jgi:hypothetical protein
MLSQARIKSLIALALACHALGGRDSGAMHWPRTLKVSNAPLTQF